LVNLRRLHASIEGELANAFARVLASGSYHLGTETALLEEEFAEHEGADLGICCGSGSDALYLALRTLDLGAGDAVVTVANTFVATAESIARTGATVLFCEPDPTSHTLDPGDLVRVLREPGGEAVRAVVPVHLYGRRADIPGIRQALQQAGRPDIAVVGDAAQAHGSPGVGGETDLTAYSFYPSKNLGALGDGGIVLCRDPSAADRIRRLRNHGRDGKHHSGELGLNSRFDEIQAAALRIKMRYLRNWNRQRRALAARYRQMLAGTPGLVLPQDSPGHVYHLFVVELEGGRALRDRVAETVRSRGVSVGLHYPVPLHHMKPYPSSRPLPISEALADRVLSLPLFPGLREDEMERVVTLLKTSLGAHQKGTQ